MQLLSCTVLQLLEQTWIPIAIICNNFTKTAKKKMLHFMQLDDRWPTHLLTTLRALLGAAASFLFGQPAFFYLGQHLSFFVLGQISKVKLLKELIYLLINLSHNLDFWHTLKSEKVKRQPGNQPECIFMLCLITTNAACRNTALPLTFWLKRLHTNDVTLPKK